MTKSMNKKVLAMQEKIKGPEPKDRTKREWRLNKEKDNGIVSRITNKIMNR